MTTMQYTSITGKAGDYNMMIGLNTQGITDKVA